MSNDCLIVIPARYGSVRFPGKVLALIAGKTMLEWCHIAAKKAGVGPVLIATEDERVVLAAKKFNAQTALTSPSCPSGTDRIYEAARMRKEPYIINLQGDEPFIQPSTIRKVAACLRACGGKAIATACCGLENIKMLHDPNCVKAVAAEDGTALYFSRSSVPFKHPLSDIDCGMPWLRHIGIYGYGRKILKKFVNLPPSRLERLERLEQLRAMEAGIPIKIVKVAPPGPAVDTASDLLRARRYIKNRQLLR